MNRRNTNLKSPKIAVRPIHPDDAAELYSIVIDPRVTRTLVTMPSMEQSETETWIRNHDDWRHRLVAQVDGQVAGSVTLRQYKNPRISHGGKLGLMVAHDFWNQGVGSALLGAILDVADNWLNLSRVELDVFTHNPAAIHLYKKFGFDIEGTRRCVCFLEGEWRHEHVMARLQDVSRPISTGLSSEWATSNAVAKKELNRISHDDLVIRPLDQEDTARVHELWRHPAVGRTTLQRPSLEFLRAKQKVENKPPKSHRFVAVSAGLVIGMISLHQEENPRLAHTAGLGMMVHPDYWGQGVGTRLMEAAIDLADNWLYLKRIELEVNTDNQAGVHLYQKLGFRIEGTKRQHTYGDGRWTDSHFMARIRG